MHASPRFAWTQPKSSLLRKVKAGLALPVLVLLIVGFLSFRSVARFSHDTQWVAHTYEAQAHLADIASALKDIETGTRSFVLTGDNAYLQPYFAGQESLRRELETVAALIADNPRQQQRLAAFKPLIDNFLMIAWGTIAERKTGDMEAALVRVHTGRGKAAMDRVHIAIQEMQDEERLLLEERGALARRSGRMTLWVIVAAILLAVLLVALAAMVIHRDVAARKRAEYDREEVIEQLREALTTVKTLTGLLPICAWCKNIRDDQGYWKELEHYIGEHTDANFTHGICPECLEKQKQEIEAQVSGAVKTSDAKATLRLFRAAPPA